MKTVAVLSSLAVPSAFAYTLNMKTGWRSPYLSTVDKVELPSFSDIKPATQPPSGGGVAVAVADDDDREDEVRLPDFSTFKASPVVAEGSPAEKGGLPDFSTFKASGGSVGVHLEVTESSLPDFSTFKAPPESVDVVNGGGGDDDDDSGVQLTSSSSSKSAHAEDATNELPDFSTFKAPTSSSAVLPEITKEGSMDFSKFKSSKTDTPTPLSPEICEEPEVVGGTSGLFQWVASLFAHPGF